MILNPHKDTVMDGPTDGRWKDGLGAGTAIRHNPSSAKLAQARKTKTAPHTIGAGRATPDPRANKRDVNTGTRATERLREEGAHKKRQIPK